MNTNLGDIELKDLLEYMGEKVIAHGRHRYKLREHDSLIFSGSTYVWNSKNEKGNFYSLLNSLYNMKGREIYKKVEEFLSDIKEKKYIPSETVKNHSEKDKRQYGIVGDAACYEKIREYLCEKRKIKEEIVKSLFQNRLLHLDSKNNIAFVIKDTNGKVQGYDLSGTGERRFKSNTSKNHGFNIEYNPELKKESVYVFEGSIDLISYIEINKERIKEKHKDEGVRFLSISGVREDILKNYIEKDIRNLYICTDNDEGGNNFYKEVEKSYSRLNVFRELPKSKDWNEDLQISKEKVKAKKKLKTENIKTLGR